MMVKQPNSPKGFARVFDKKESNNAVQSTASPNNINNSNNNINNNNNNATTKQISSGPTKSSKVKSDLLSTINSVKKGSNSTVGLNISKSTNSLLNNTTNTMVSTTTSKGIVANLNKDFSNINVNSAASIAIVDDKSAIAPVNKDKDAMLHTMNPQDKLLFSKMKKSKLAGYDPKKLLPEEALRLEKGDVSDIAKDSKRSTLLHEKAAELVLEQLQNDCIFSTTGATGKSSVALFPNRTWRDIPGLADPLDVDVTSQNKSKSVHTLGSSFNVERQWQDMAKAEDMQLQKVVSFEDFQNMFRSYSAEALSSTRDNFTKTSRSAGSSNPSSLSPIPVKETPEKADNKLGVTAAGMIPSVQPVDVISALKTKDTQFVAFAKITMADKPVNKMISKSTSAVLTQPKKLRIIPPIGKSALDLSNIRSLRNSKGFHNVFEDMPQYKDEIAALEEETHEVTEEMSDDDEEEDVHGDKKLGVLLDDDGSYHSNGSMSGSSPGSVQNALRRKQRAAKPRSKKSKPDEMEKSALSVNAEDAVSALQQKIVAIHHALQLSATARINFMFKYSSAAFSQGNLIFLYYL